MSLKAFHIVFVAASVLLCLVFGGWLLNEFFRGGASVAYLVFGVLMFAAGGGLVVYGRYFLKKLKHISYL
jgi:hypothetical protein